MIKSISNQKLDMSLEYFFHGLKFSHENLLIKHEIKSDEPSKWWDAYLGSFVTPI
jgi:hypothetical protein